MITLEISKETLDLLNEHTETSIAVNSINEETQKYVISISDELYVFLAEAAGANNITIEQYIQRKAR